jgi:hypothetical protein
MEWQNNTTLFDGNDGGIYKTVNGGVNWTHHTNGMQISQMYRLGVSQTTNAVITGLQDNGTKFRNNSNTWSDVLGGDGMECAIDYSNAQYMYGELYFGDIYRSSNTGGSWTSLDPLGQGGTGDWITPYIISSSSATTLYAGYNDVYKSTNRGTSWTQISTNLSPSNDLTILADAPSDANVLYAGRSSALYRTTNGGTSWSTMTVPAGAGSTDLSVCQCDRCQYHLCQHVELHVRQQGLQVNQWRFYLDKHIRYAAQPASQLHSIPEGFSGRIVCRYGCRCILPRQYHECVAALVGTGLPNVVITELDIRYSTGKLRVSTYGRGLWETDINCVSPVVTAPTVTQPTCAVTTGTIVVNATGNATLEYSINGGTSWQTSNTFASLAPDPTI